VTAALRRSVSSLQIPNYRRYFAGQIVSLSGNWMQTVAEIWLILELTGSGVAVGTTAALQFLPILLFGAWGGVIADRFPKRSLLVVTQAAMAIPALVLWGVTAAGTVEPWMVFALVFVRGTVNSVDNPTRQSFVIEMVGADRVVNAVGLNSVLIHSARMIGPAAAGVLIATVGIAPCFLLNATTFVAMIAALRSMDPEQLAAPATPHRSERGVLAALRYVRSEPALLIPLAMMAVVGLLAFNFQVMLPLLARFAYDGGPAAYSALAVAMALGSIAGALFTGARRRVTERLLVGAAAAFGLAALAVAAAPNLPLALVGFVPLGAASVCFAAGVNSTLQLHADPAMRGRVLALYSVVFLGSTPIGGPLVGWLAELAGPRAGLVLAGIATLAAAAGGAAAFARRRGEDPLHGLRRLPGSSGWRRRRLRHRRAVAMEPRGADQLHRLERRGGLDVEADAVALLDRGDGVLAAPPDQGDQDRVAGADRRNLRPDPARDSGGESESADRPQPQEGDPARGLRRQAGRGARSGERSRHRLARAGRATEHQPRGAGHQPPCPGDDEGRRVGVAVGDRDADRPESRGDRGDEENGDPQ
jgi:MFS family permease